MTRAPIVVAETETTANVRLCCQGRQSRDSGEGWLVTASPAYPDDFQPSPGADWGWEQAKLTAGNGLSELHGRAAGTEYRERRIWECVDGLHRY